MDDRQHYDSEHDRSRLPSDPRGGSVVPAPIDVPAPVTQREGGGYYDASTRDEFNIWEYINVVIRRRWTVAAVLLICLLSAATLSLTATPLYRSTVLMKIQPGGPKVTDFASVQESVAQSQAYNDFYQTQYDILSSRTLARRTIDLVGLRDNPYFNGDHARSSLVGRVKAMVLGLLPSSENEISDAEAAREQRLVNRFLESVEVRPRRKSFLAEVSFISPDPELSQQVTSTLSEQYIDLTLDQGVEAAMQARGFIEKQLFKIKGALEHSETELHDFARGHDIVALEQEERVINERLVDLNTRFTETQAQRISLAALDEQTQRPDISSLTPVMNNPLIKTLREALASAASERAALAATFTDQFPAVRTIDARIARLKTDIAAEERRIVSGIQSDFRQAVERESLIGEKLDQQKRVVASYEEMAVAFKIHQREVETNRTIYENLLLRMKEVEVTEAIRASNINIVDPAEVPLEASSPNLALSLALAMFLGSFGGVASAFLQEYVDDSLKTPDDVERYLGLATLGTIPEFAIAKTEAATDDQTPDLEVAQHPTSAGSEAIRTLRASLFLAAPGGLPTRLLLTSARPGEGKTCIIVNLATALAQMGRKVCLIDCDLRRPRVNRALDVSLSPGVTNNLTGNMTLDEVIRPSGQPGLDVITAGPIPPNPVDLLGSANMSQMLKELDERYDHVLIDAPPALGFADVPIITNQLGGGVLLVTRSGATSKRLAKQACDYLIRMQSHMLGVVLNRVSTKSAGYSYYGYYGYYGDYYTRREDDETLPNVESVA